MHGLDQVSAPDAGTAKAMLDKIGGSWWAVYYGGPRRNGASIKTWTPATVAAYRKKGISRFLAIYVGRQVLINGRPPNKQIDDTPHLTGAQGKIEGADACSDAEPYGFGPGSPLCLDLENETFERARQGSVAYMLAWCKEVRARGFRPGVYANRPALQALHGHDDAPDWVWLAKWVGHSAAPDLDPHVIDGFADHLWRDVGCRVWQYAGHLHNPERPCQVLGINVDISVADEACLIGGHPTHPTDRLAEQVRKEDDMVIMITAPQKAPRALVGSRLIGFKGGHDLETFRTACAKADVPIIDWQCSVDQYNETSATFSR